MNMSNLDFFNYAIEHFDGKVQLKKETIENHKNQILAILGKNEECWQLSRGTWVPQWTS